MRLIRRDGDSTPFVGAAAALMAATGVFWLAAVIRYALEAAAGTAQRCDTRG